ncbi:MAG TPA: class I SAM-dependent methyltransferase [Ktedonobacterales bacterium]|nr:class I SAM-dependent methyltransferase [Ktedonobacterales bacterium]
MPVSRPYDRQDVQHFERWSRTYEGSWMQRRLFDPVHQATLDFAATLPAPASVLDVGCGTGRLLRAVASRWPYAHLIGVDPAQGMVEAARALTPGADIQRGLAEALPLPDASVDLAVSTLSFHHWGDQSAGVREIARVLRPGGHFILADFAPPSTLARLRLTGRAQPRAERQRIFEAAGLRVERSRDIVYPFILATLAAR